MTEQNSLCLTCFEDWRVPGGTACLACTLNRAQRLGTTSSNVRGFDRGTWWGPTANDVDTEDLSNGYTVDEV
jgi:hypothetical protein